jgi:GTP-binding protein LepA
VDFTYEVSRSLAACEGALLVVDASQGVEAQTVANTYLAIDAGLELIPTMNKVDLPGAEPERVADEIAELIGEPADEVRGSAPRPAKASRSPRGARQRVPPPAGDPDAPPRALIFDSEYDQYRGVIAYIRVVDGRFHKGAVINAMAARTQAEIDDIGFFTPKETPVQSLGPGEVGYLITGIKDVNLLRVGDTLTTKANPAAEALPGYRDVKPMVFCGLFPIQNDDYPELRDALEKLTLNDAALSWEPETSDALGFGFRCGFLGLLHMDIVRERLEREYDLELMATMPSVAFEVELNTGEVLEVHNPTDFPDPSKIKEIREPYVKVSVLAPKEYIGQVMELATDRRGVHDSMHFLSSERVQLTYDLPLSEIVLDFFDQLKSRTRGYASLDYDPIGVRPSNLVKLDVLLAGDTVDALSMIVHRDKAYEVGKVLTEKLRKKIPRQQYDVPIQAAIGSKIVARETVKAYRKDVTAKCYGGDISRKRKLMERQKEGKKRMKQVGRIECPRTRSWPCSSSETSAHERHRQDLRARHVRGGTREDPRIRPRRRRDGSRLPRSRGGARGRIPRRGGAADVRRRLQRARARRRPLRPRSRHRLLPHGPRRPGVHLGRGRGGGRRDHHGGAGARHRRARRDGLLRLRDALAQPGRRARLHRDLDQHRAGNGMSRHKPGEQLPEVRITPDKYLTVRYAGASGDFNPIHVDEEFAKSVGLPGRILHGLWTMAQVARAQTQAAGGPEHLKRLSVQFRGMGLPELEVVVRSTIERLEGDVAHVKTVAEQEGRLIVRNAEAEVVL